MQSINTSSLRLELLQRFDRDPFAFDELMTDHARELESSKLSMEIDNIWDKYLSRYIEESESDQTLPTYQKRERNAFVELINSLSRESLINLTNVIDDLFIDTF